MSKLILEIEDDGRAVLEKPIARRSGLTGFISWQRLVAAFRSNGELKANEIPVQFICDPDGITFTVTVTSPPVTAPRRLAR